MHTWALICSIALNQAGCDFDTAERWFEVSHPTHIQAAIMRLGVFDPKNQFIKTFKYEGSLGTDSYIYYPCDGPSYPDETIYTNDPENLSYLRRQFSKGACLR
jgi:hypothetical protein